MHVVYGRNRKPAIPAQPDSKAMVRRSVKIHRRPRTKRGESQARSTRKQPMRGSLAPGSEVGGTERRDRPGEEGVGPGQRPRGGGRDQTGGGQIGGPHAPEVHGPQRG